MATRAPKKPMADLEPSTAPKPPFLKEITLRSILSFGPDTPPVPLGPLNVLIGPNGSGKSNLIDCLSLLRAARTDYQRITQKGGGVVEWIWKGASDQAARIQAVVSLPQSYAGLRHSVSFCAQNFGFYLLNDEITPSDLPLHPAAKSYHLAQPTPNAVITISENGASRSFDGQFNTPLLAQYRNPEQSPELVELEEFYRSLAIYREWQWGRNTPLRSAQPADMRTDRLEEDFSNLALFLNRLGFIANTKQNIVTRLKDLYDGITGYAEYVISNSIQLIFSEGDYSIPATRLSDGTLRYLCLLAILCDPNPPPLICIEEPEIGLHPDILHKIADLLVEASNRTQLIVTTHSDIIIDALTEHPEAVLVCEKHDGQTNIERLDAGDLQVWLAKYRLGQLWLSGQIGGTRW